MGCANTKEQQRVSRSTKSEDDQVYKKKPQVQNNAAPVFNSRLVRDEELPDLIPLDSALMKKRPARR